MLWVSSSLGFIANVAVADPLGLLARRGLGRGISYFIEAIRAGEFWAVALVVAAVLVILAIVAVNVINHLGTPDSEQVELTEEEKNLINRY